MFLRAQSVCYASIVLAVSPSFTVFRTNIDGANASLILRNSEIVMTNIGGMAELDDDQPSVLINSIAICNGNPC